MSEANRQRSTIHEELQELRAGYSHTIDNGIESGEWDPFLSLYSEEAVVDYPDATLTGREEIKSFGHQLEEMYEFTMHTAQMPTFDIDGDKATATWYMAVFYSATDGSAGIALGRYEDEYQRVDDEWKFARVGARVTHDTDGFHI